jgi:glycosyltransferase involved in cell wall biosynthesis
MKYKILIFIITFKASFRVIDLVKKLPINYLKKHDFQIYVSDDCSNDDTVNYIDKIMHKFSKKLTINVNKKNLGYGGNIKKCINFAFKNDIDYAVMLHGDNQYNPKYLENMLEKITKNKNMAAMTGTRMSKKINALKGKMPLYKFVGNIVLTKLFNILYNKSFTDCHTGYWVYNLNIIKKTFFKKADNNFCFDIDMRLMLTENNLSIGEQPIETIYGNERSSIHFVYAFRFFLKVLRFRLFKKL